MRDGFQGNPWKLAARKSVPLLDRRSDNRFVLQLFH